MDLLNCLDLIHILNFNRYYSIILYFLKLFAGFVFFQSFKPIKQPCHKNRRMTLSFSQMPPPGRYWCTYSSQSKWVFDKNLNYCLHPNSWNIFIHFSTERSPCRGSLCRCLTLFAFNQFLSVQIKITNWYFTQSIFIQFKCILLKRSSIM